MTPAIDSSASNAVALPAYNAIPDGGGGSVVQTAPEPIFPDPENQGVDPLGETPPVSVSEDPDATPAEVAAYVKYHNAGLNPEQGRIEYLEALAAHKDDAAWLAEFYQQLGPEATADLIAQTTDPLNHGTGGQGSDPEIAQLQTDAIRESFESLQAAGYLDEASITAILNEFPNNDSINYAATEIFGKADVALKETFIAAAMRVDNDRWNAGALEVLNGLDPSRQQRLLMDLSDTERDAFIEGAMLGEQPLPRFEDAVRYGIHTNMMIEQEMIEPETYGGMQQLLDTANGVTVYYHARITVPNFGASLQSDLFSSVAKGLNNDAAFEQFRDDAGFKEELSTLYMNNSERILHEQAPDGAFTDAGFVEGMTSFFELTLFTDNAGSNRETLMESVVETMSDVGMASAAPPLSQAEYETAHGGWSQQDHVEVMGGLQGMVLQAASNQKDYLQSEILADQEQREQMIGFVTGMAFSFVPGAGDVLGSLASGGGNWLSQVPGTIAEFGYDQATSQLEEGSTEALMQLLGGLGDSSQQDQLANVDAFLESFKDTIIGTSAALPNGEAGELNLRTAFQSAFAFYRDLLSF